MKVSYLLLISFLIVGTLCIPAVSAEAYNETIVETSDIISSYKISQISGGGTQAYKLILQLYPAESFANSELKTITYKGNVHPNGDIFVGWTHSKALNSLQSYAWDNVPLRIGNTVVGHADIGFYRSGAENQYVTWYVWFDEQPDLSGRTGIVTLTPDFSNYYYNSWGIYTTRPTYVVEPLPEQYAILMASWDSEIRIPGYQLVNVDANYAIFWSHWKCQYEVSDNYTVGPESFFDLNVNRNVDGTAYYSQVLIKTKDGAILYNDANTQDLQFPMLTERQMPYQLAIKNPATETWFNRTIGFAADIPVTPTPTDPSDQSVLRRGTVTMTDHNGTSISGFEVTAVNHYTGQEYTVTTDTDIAVMDLPMDRTTEIRNPQTGEYEEVPIGYYKFYGQAPGYKMLYEDGIQVTVVPEKYSSYQLCNILVTSESGPLTGKHKFQIKSRADNSILQTGTISAQSATTGEWYNTSVSGGIATLILPYDTTSIISEYAGLYLVYATSPGYEENDYGTQISVYPQTVSEIKTVLLTPIGGVSTPDNVTLRIQAVSETGTGVVNAQIFIAGVYGAGKDVWDTYTASSTGYLEVSVPGNSTYDIVASGDGFYDSARRVEVFTEDPGLIELKLYLSGYPTLEPPTQPTGWPTDPPPTQPTGGIPDEDDDSDGFLVQAVRGIGQAFGVGFSTAKTIFGMLLALSIGFTTAKKLRGGAAEFGIGLLGGTMLGVLIGLLPVWIIVVLLLVVGLYVGNRYVGGSNSG